MTQWMGNHGLWACDTGFIVRRTTVVSVEQRPTHQWIVSVKNMADVIVNSGESIEIGRKPLRPLPDEGKTRLDVPDETRSMSKRHAVFVVAASGSATIRDLHSTNGTYIVRADGGLVRVPLDQDFPLPRNEMTLQFGDVPATFKRQDIQPQHDPKGRRSGDVSDLFSYASDNGPVEPDAADMSVDDILDLRAGEPTSAFDASSVRSRITQLHDAVLGEANAHDRDGAEPERRESKVADASVTDASGTDASQVDRSAVDSANAESAEKTEKAVEARQSAKDPASVAPGESDESGQRDLFEDALSDALHIEDDAQKSPGEEMQRNPEGDTGHIATGASSVSHGEGASSGDASSQTVFTPLASAQLDDDAQRVSQTDGTARDGQPESNEGAFKPVFEPGSVFEKVSKGEFSKKQHIVEVDGFTSDDARTSHDFTKQFDMARHSELLPFLAMNTSLYDDLYTWLAAQGNHDVDVALQSNTGYQEYLEATRK